MPLLLADMYVSILGTVERSVNMNMYILGGATIDLNIAIQGDVQKTVGMNMQITGSPLVRTDLDMLILNETPYRFMRMRGDLLTRYFGGNTSDANFPELFNPPSLSGVESSDIGVFSAAHRSLVFTTKNQIPTPTDYDRYSLALNAAVDLDTIGFRLLTAFRLEAFGPNSDLAIGLANDSLSPQELEVTGDVALLRLEAEKGHVELRAYLGTSASPRFATGLPVDYFVGKDLVLEIEQVDEGVINVVEFRLYERARSLSVPLFTVVGRTTVVPTVDRFSISSYGRATPELPTDQPDLMASFEFIDIELATGSIYNPPGTGLPLIEAKMRPIQDRPPIELVGEGTNTIYVALFFTEAHAASIETSASIEIDTSDPEITVTEFTPDSLIIEPGSTNPQIVKGSPAVFNETTGLWEGDFDRVTMKWKCTHVGEWTLRVDSSSPTDGIEISNGEYPVADAEVYTTWNFRSLPDIDGVYDVTLYVIADTGKATAKKLGIYILP